MKLNTNTFQTYSGTSDEVLGWIREGVEKVAGMAIVDARNCEDDALLDAVMDAASVIGAVGDRSERRAMELLCLCGVTDTEGREAVAEAVREAQMTTADRRTAVVVARDDLARATNELEAMTRRVRRAANALVAAEEALAASDG